MTIRMFDEADALLGKRVLVRVDFNLPMEDGKVVDGTRIQAAVPTINTIINAGGRAILLAHMGRPKGTRNEAMSLRQIVPAVEEVLGRPVAFAGDCIGPAAEKAVAAMKDGDVLLLENLRFHPGEENNDPDFAKALARLGDIYVNDAFSVAHRAAASTVGLAALLPAYAGLGMQKEIEALTKALTAPERPVAAIVGGAKVSTKIELLENLVTKVNALVIGGAMANTFLAAEGKAVGKSLVERDHLDTARTIAEKAKAAGCALVLPSDAVVATEFRANAPHRTVPSGMVGQDEMILDAGPQSAGEIGALLEKSKTLVWNGPLGAFEHEPFDAATNAVARKAADLTKAGKLLSVAGGGDTVAALNQAGAADSFSYISTAGGAFLEWLEGKPLPGVEALKKTG